MPASADEEYGRREVVDPRRRLTSTVRTWGLARRRLSVRSSGEIPLGRLVEAARALDAIVVDSPLDCGDLVVGDFLGLHVDILATDTIGTSGRRRRWRLQEGELRWTDSY